MSRTHHGHGTNLWDALLGWTAARRVWVDAFGAPAGQVARFDSPVELVEVYVRAGLDSRLVEERRGPWVPEREWRPVYRCRTGTPPGDFERCWFTGYDPKRQRKGVTTVTNSRHWASALRRQADYLRGRAERLSEDARLTTGAYAIFMQQANAFEEVAERIEEALALERELFEALADVRELARAADPAERGGQQGRCGYRRAPLVQ